MERLWIVWLDDQKHWNMPIRLMLLQEKAQRLFSWWKRLRWRICWEFDPFKGRANLGKIKAEGEAPSADISAAHDCPEMSKKIIEEGVYLPDQIFNIDETGLVGKKCLNGPTF